jgi:DNA repair protein RecO (recombination protein O)
MSEKKTVDGLVIRETAFGENDKLLTVLTADDGQMTIMAKGARSIKSKVLPLCRLFTYANFEYYERSQYKWLSGGSVDQSFFGLSSDMTGFALSSYIVQLAGEITGEGVEAEEVLRMTLNTLYAIEKKLYPYAQIKAVYECFAANISGFEPDLSVCSKCRKAPKADVWLDVMNGSIACEECQSKLSGSMPIEETDRYETRNILVPLEASALAAMRYVQGAPIRKAFSFSLKTEASLSSFERAAETYILNHLERSFDTLDFYKNVKD